MRALQQIGLRHPRIRQVRHFTSGAGQDRQLLVAEGLWAHKVLVGLDAAVEMFLWCPEAAYSAEAQSLGTQVAARARYAYRIAPAVLDRLCERERPDGLLSLVRLPAWDADRVELNADALATVSTGATPYLQASYSCRTALVVGNERTGITQPWFSHASGEVTIPMVGRADSLNVAVSASILMYDIRSVLSGAAGARASDRRPRMPGPARQAPRLGIPLVEGRQLAL